MILLRLLLYILGLSQQSLPTFSFNRIPLLVHYVFAITILSVLFYRALYPPFLVTLGLYIYFSTYFLKQCSTSD